jgi:hypothetical protein
VKRILLPACQLFTAQIDGMTDEFVSGLHSGVNPKQGTRIFVARPLNAADGGPHDLGGRT